MAEAEIGRRRRLPLWMSSAATSTTTASATVYCKQRGKIVDKNGSASSSIQEEEEEEEDSSVVVKRGTRKRVIKNSPSPQLETVDSEDEFSLPNKKKKTTRKQVEPSQKPPRTKIRQQRRKKEESTSAAEEDHEEEELTVDDLMSIAQEYVKADDGKAHELEKTTEAESEEQIATTSLTSRNDSGGSSFSIKVPPTHTSLGFLSNSDQTKLTHQEHSACEEIIHSSSRTGDPAQDMLNLFLGPLLKKPQTEETKRETFREEISLDYELQKLSQKEELGKQVTTLVKKKSSLRDKVAMLLD